MVCTVFSILSTKGFSWQMGRPKLTKGIEILSLKGLRNSSTKLDDPQNGLSDYREI